MPKIYGYVTDGHCSSTTSVGSHMSTIKQSSVKKKRLRWLLFLEDVPPLATHVPTSR